MQMQVRRWRLESGDELLVGLFEVWTDSICKIGVIQLHLTLRVQIPIQSADHDTRIPIPAQGIFQRRVSRVWYSIVWLPVPARREGENMCQLRGLAGFYKTEAYA